MPSCKLWSLRNLACLLLFARLLGVAASPADPLLEALRGMQFRNSGTTSRHDRFRWQMIQPSTGGFLYLEPQNVTTLHTQWGYWGALSNQTNSGRFYKFLVSANRSSEGYEGTSPASGIRSAVPLGGLSCGSVELRGDGSFSEWTIMNQSPAGAAKIAEHPDALFALRVCGVGGCSTKILQTHPHGAAAEGTVEPVDALAYSGSYPVSRLEPLDAGFELAAPGLTTALFGYSSIAAGNMTASARPAAAFTLTASNQAATASNVTLVLNMPLQIESDQERIGTALGLPSAALNSSVCAHRCQQTADCLTWNFYRASAQCQLQSDGPLNRYSLGTDAGVRGAWVVDQDGRCITLTRPGQMPFSGQVSLCGSSPDGTQLFPHNDLPAALDALGHGNLLPSVTPGQQAAVLVRALLAPGESKTVTVTLGWRFPYLDWFNYDCSAAAPGQKPWPCQNNSGVAGNHYASIYPTAREAAWAGANGVREADLLQTLSSIDAVHSAVSYTHLTLPTKRIV
eukprot:TRINITY_DN24020_c0_g1_i2.p1 TRINITY_DN24020_c0_g1~~TRINITY_DN24020_c0_g1_i2.p1  ORF type:complete len:511 (+),score=72.21 TRINITY_DN24020_c0_g1_i2:194-1726(+)